MLLFIFSRLIFMIPKLLVISFVTFSIVKASPGDYLSNQLAETQLLGDDAATEQIIFLQQKYAQDRPFIEQYGIWLGVVSGKDGFRGLLQGDLGYSFAHDKPVLNVIGDSFGLLVLLTVTTVLFTCLIAFPIGVLGAIRQHSSQKNSFSFTARVIWLVANFLIALLLIYFAKVLLNNDVGSLMNTQYSNLHWSLDKVISVLAHLWILVFIVGIAASVAVAHDLKINLLDQLQKPYMVTARAKGIKPLTLLLRYPIFMALDRFIANVGNILPRILSAWVIVSIVFSLEATGPMILRALHDQDHYLAAGLLFLFAVLTVIGKTISDIMSGLLYPDTRVRKGSA